MPRLMSAISLLAVTLVGGTYLQAPRVQAAGPPKANRQTAIHQRTSATLPAVAPPERALLDRYCVTCHNEKLKTADLMLDKVDIADATGNQELLEKIVRKLRSGLMPPEGRPRPDNATLDSFASSLEAALDRSAALGPNPARVAPPRLTRAEYVSVIHVLLALDVDGAALLPSDMAGFGFDNTADVLPTTPGLMSRYTTAATKI